MPGKPTQLSLNAEAAFRDLQKASSAIRQTMQAQGAEHEHQVVLSKGWWGWCHLEFAQALPEKIRNSPLAYVLFSAE